MFCRYTCNIEEENGDTRFRATFSKINHTKNHIKSLWRATCHPQLSCLSLLMMHTLNYTLQLL